jgi:hypothetical protein
MHGQSFIEGYVAIENHPTQAKNPKAILHNQLRRLRSGAAPAARSYACAPRLDFNNVVILTL